MSRRAMRYSKCFIDTEWVINSIFLTNNIEGEDITIEETRAVIRKDVEESRRIKDYKRTLISDFYIAYKYISQTLKEELSVDFILFLHSLILSGTKFDIAGKYKEVNKTIGADRNVKFTPFYLVKDEMIDLINWYSSEPATIERIAEFKLRFICIHPFTDGNGRIARMIVQRELCKIGEYPTTFSDIKKDYCMGLMSRSYYSKSSKELSEFIKKSVLEEKPKDAVSEASDRLRSLYK